MSEFITHDPIPGFEAPVHRALTEPILLGGAPRAVAITNGTLAAAVGLGLRLWIAGLAALGDRAHGGGLGRKARRAVRRRRAPTPALSRASRRVRRYAMLNLAEYRKKPKMLADFLPWAALVAPGVILNKDGSFQRTARFRGPDLEFGNPGRARRHHRAAQQCAASPRLRMGDFRRGKPHCGTALSAEPVS